MSTRTFVVVGSIAAIGLTIGGWRWQATRSAPVGGERRAESSRIAAASDAPAATPQRSGGFDGTHRLRAWPSLALSPPAPERRVVVPTPSDSTPPTSDAERTENQRVAAEFAERIKEEVARCFVAHVHAKGNVTFRYDFKGDGDHWTISDSDDGLQMIDSTIPESEDDAAVSCMRQAAKGATMTKAGSMFESAEGYQLYWSWNVT